MVASDSLKTDGKQKTGKSRQISAVDQHWVQCLNDDLSRGGHEIVETTSENSYYTLTCSYGSIRSLN